MSESGRRCFVGLTFRPSMKEDDRSSQISYLVASYAMASACRRIVAGRVVDRFILGSGGLATKLMKKSSKFVGRAVVVTMIASEDHRRV
ncbi:MAG: hypothetical protein R3F54_31460 [Alphaproteobacteria bacterium]